MSDEKRWYYRSGVRYTGDKFYRGTSKDGGSRQVPTKCSRCGGSGRFAHYGVCFRCGGDGLDPVPDRVYTAEKLERLNAAAEKRASAKQDAWIERCKAALAEAQAQVEGFDVARIQGQLIVSSGVHKDIAFSNSLKRKVEKISDLLDHQLWTAPRAKFLVELVKQYNELAGKVQSEHNADLEAAKNPANWIRAGRQEIEGEVLSVKQYDSNFGPVTKVLIKSGHQKFFGSWTLGPVERGDRVKLRATVKPSADDKLFATFARPTNQERVESDEDREGRIDGEVALATHDSFYGRE